MNVKEARHGLLECLLPFPLGRFPPHALRLELLEGRCRKGTASSVGSQRERIAD